MNIILIGYMASGKSLIGQKLRDVLGMPFIDFDSYIEQKENATINDIFDNKGEIYFRKNESIYLKELLHVTKNSIISLGGGTPCYANNMDLIRNQENSKSIYLYVTVNELSKRLFADRNKRPLVRFISSENEMTEFVGKHLFERTSFYNQADITIKANGIPSEIVEKIILELF
jgi:shikimate kinase